jgi:hypothetical protein
MRLSKFRFARFLLRAHKSPHTEKTLSTYACEEGAATMSSANGANNGCDDCRASQNDTEMTQLHFQQYHHSDQSSVKWQ